MLFIRREIGVTLRTIDQTNLQDKRVFVRVDFRVPLTNEKVADDPRIRTSLPTINHAIEHGTTPLILTSHLEGFQGEPVPK